MSQANQNTPNTEQAPTSNKNELQKLISQMWGIFGEIIDLRKGVDKQGTIDEISTKKSMSGANAWMLMCSILIASLGLDLNSPAVIIGAMLISPLMSPILGIGMGYGINDKDALRHSLSHFGVAIFIAVVTSSLYFFLSPFGDITPEIEARTEPTILDILIAFFGGIAGIISYARKDISTTIPGVAIATALMPPLCVTGFGIANGEWQIASSAFYLFFLNSFFVSLATYLIIRYLRFPYMKYINKKERRRNMAYMWIFGLITIIPSIFIANKVVKNLRLENNINAFITEYLGSDKIYLDKYIYLPSDTINTLVFKVYGTNINDSKMELYNQGLAKHKIDNTKLSIISTSEVNLDRLEILEKQVSGVRDLAIQLESTKREKTEQNQIIENLKNRLNFVTSDSITFDRLNKEIKIFFPEIDVVAFGRGPFSTRDTIINNTPIISVRWTSIPNRIREEKENQLRQLISLHFKEEFQVVSN